MSGKHLKNDANKDAINISIDTNDSNQEIDQLFKKTCDDILREFPIINYPIEERISNTDLDNMDKYLEEIIGMFTGLEDELENENQNLNEVENFIEKHSKRN